MDCPHHWRRSAAAIGAGMLLLACAGCGGWSRPSTQTGPPTPPPSTLAFDPDIRPLAGRCGACHPALVPNAGRMDDYANITSQGFVKPGDPDNSPYYTKPSGKAPHGGGPVWGTDAQTVHDWIQQGAKER